MLLLRFLLLVALLFSSSCVVNSPIAVSSGAGEDVVPDSKIVFKKVGETELKVHLFKPEGFKKTDKRPVAVFFFGGAWVGGTPTQFYPHCKYLASRGMVAMTAEYRVESRDGTTPKECVKDGKSVIRWIRSHAGNLGIDPDRVVAGGGSAGGHVAAATANLTAFEEIGENLAVSSRPDALVLFNAVFDNGPGGFGYDVVEDYWEDISPMHNISVKSPPTLVFLGTRDKLIPVATGREYKRRMDEVGRRCELKLYRGKKHGFFNVKKVRNYVSTVKEMDKFLVSLGFLEAKVPKMVE